MKYKYSCTEVTTFNEKGKANTKSICSVCRKKHKNDYGFSIEAEMTGTCFASKSGYCFRCANKLIPILHDALEKIEQEEEKIKQSIPAEIKKAREDEETTFWEDLSKEMERGNGTWTIKIS